MNENCRKEFVSIFEKTRDAFKCCFGIVCGTGCCGKCSAPKSGAVSTEVEEVTLRRKPAAEAVTQL